MTYIGTLLINGGCCYCDASLPGALCDVIGNIAFVSEYGVIGVCGVNITIDPVLQHHHSLRVLFLSFVLV